MERGLLALRLQHMMKRKLRIEILDTQCENEKTTLQGSKVPLPIFTHAIKETTS